MEPNTVEFLERMLDISRIMAENRELDSLLQFAMQVAMELVGAEQGHLILLGDKGTLDFRVSQGVRTEVSHSVLDRVLGDQAPLRITDALSDEEFLAAPSIQGLQLRSIMGVPLISRDKLLGAVYVENRSLANIFYEPHLDVLVFFAKQAAVLIENAILAVHLQKAREEIVTTREEERRRIRRDLQRELGPSLAALRLELDTTQNILIKDKEAGIRILDDMQGEVEDILTKVRHLVYQLRPPALDQLGLISAIQEHIVICREKSDIQIEMILLSEIPPLSAALEVAIYRIVLEAVSNVIQQAQATYCHIRLMVNEDAWLVIEDDRQGITVNSPASVGIASMHKHVTELGGRFQLTNHPGTKIEMYLPLVI